MNPLSPSPDTIWGYEQNRPSLIAKDFEQLGVPKAKTYAILMARGVMKWLAVRRDLIKLKNVWKHEITRTIAEIRAAKREDRRDDLHRLRGKLETLERCRGQVRMLCHSPRWRAPDFDGGAWRWMEEVAPGARGDVSPQLRREIRQFGRERLAS